jgi:hypothetical protein
VVRGRLRRCMNDPIRRVSIGSDDGLDEGREEAMALLVLVTIILCIALGRTTGKGGQASLCMAFSALEFDWDEISTGPRLWQRPARNNRRQEAM